MPVIEIAPGSGDTPVTVSDLINATRDHLMGTYRSEWNTLVNEVGPTDTTLTFTGDTGGIVRTTYLAVDDELMYVMEVSKSDKTALVIRGFDSTIPAQHVATAMVEVAPRFPRNRIRRALAAEIMSWPTSLFAVGAITIDLVADGRTFAYDLTPLSNSLLLYLLDVRHEPWTAGNRNTWPQFAKICRINRAAPTDLFPSGLAIEIVEPIGGNVRAAINYGTPFNTSDFSDSVILVGDPSPGCLGLASSMIDIPSLGAAQRLLAPREIVRTLSEAKDQEASMQELPAGLIGQVAQRLQAARDQRIVDEAERLSVQWPFRVQ